MEEEVEEVEVAYEEAHSPRADHDTAKQYNPSNLPRAATLLPAPSRPTSFAASAAHAAATMMQAGLADADEALRAFIADLPTAPYTGPR
jgi:hypothetical protein